MKTNFTMQMKFYLLAISFFGFINFSNAQNAPLKITWKGTVDNNFYNEKNWDNTNINFEDFNNTNLIIGAGSPYNPVNAGYKGPEKTPKRPGQLITEVGANIFVTGNFVPYGESILNGTITVDAADAQLNVRKAAYIGKGASGTLNINAGNAAVKNNLYIGNDTGGTGWVNINNGTTLGIGGALEIGTGAGFPTGYLKIKGGTVTVETDINIGINGHVSINGNGKLILTGNKEEVLKAYVKSRTIGCTLGKQLQVVFDGTKTSVSILEAVAK